MRARIGWADNSGGLDVARAANALAGAGVPVWWCPRAGHGAEAADYIADAPDRMWRMLAADGLKVEPWRRARPQGARRIGAPRIALLAGRAAAYPFFAYYALCLTRLGFTYTPVDGRMIADGVLESHDVFVLPGGFSIWGLDRGERIAGADAAVRRFLHDGGACIGSCGGAFYLSAGRPGWLGVADALPRPSHEYLRTGTGIVSVILSNDEIAAGLPPTMELPYVHGPVYHRPGKSAHVVASFEGLSLPSRVFIDNPLATRTFAQEMAGAAAILRTDGRRGRAVLFSPHPELGDLWRKYVAFDGYVRRYLPIRGRAVMADTLAHYAPLDSPCFRLVLNAIHALAPSARGERRAAARQSAPLAPARYGTQARGRLRRLLSRLRSDVRSELARNVGRGLDRRLGDGMPLLTGALKALGRAPRDRAGELCAAWDHLAAAGMARQIWAARRNGKMADELLEVELVASLHESFAGLARVTRASEEAAAR